MNESKCPHCGEPMVWVGDMLSGGLKCQDALCEAIDIPTLELELYEVIPPTPIPYPVPSLETIREFYSKSKGLVVPDDGACDPQICTDHTNDRLNYELGARRSGRTTNMLCVAINSAKPAIVVTHNYRMIKVCKDIMEMSLGCKSYGPHTIITPFGFVVEFMTVEEILAYGRLRGRRDIPRDQLFFDHMVQGQDVCRIRAEVR